MGGRKLAVYTTAVNDAGEMVTFPAGTVVSEKVAEGITNPKAWGDDSDAEGVGGEAVVPYAKRKKGELEALVAERNADRDEADQIVVGGTGKVSDLAEALDADDAASAES